MSNLKYKSQPRKYATLIDYGIIFHTTENKKNKQVDFVQATCTNKKIKLLPTCQWYLLFTCLAIFLSWFTQYCYKRKIMICQFSIPQ